MMYSCEQRLAKGQLELRKGYLLPTASGIVVHRPNSHTLSHVPGVHCDVQAGKNRSAQRPHERLNSENNPAVASIFSVTLLLCTHAHVQTGQSVKDVSEGKGNVF